MNTKTVGGTTYRLIPEPVKGWCEGCAARHYSQAQLCDQLRPGCAKTGSIYVEDLSVQSFRAGPESSAPIKPKIVIKVEGGAVTYVCGNADVEVVVYDSDRWPSDAAPEEEVYDAICAGLKKIPLQNSL